MAAILSFIQNHIVGCSTWACCAAVMSVAALPPLLNNNYHQQMNLNLFRKFSFSENSNDSKNKFDDFEIVQTSNNDLIRGTTNYNNGNYIIYFGSDSCPNCNELLFNQREAPNTVVSTGTHSQYQTGEFYKNYDAIKKKSSLQDIEFLFFSDATPDSNNSNNDNQHRLPWAEWTENDLSMGKILGDYIRHDASAVNFRYLREIFKSYFSTKSEGIPLVIVYKEGYPKVFGHDKFDELEAKKKDKENTTDKEKKEKDAQSYELLEYVQYYYTTEFIVRSS